MQLYLLYTSPWLLLLCLSRRFYTSHAISNLRQNIVPSSSKTAERWRRFARGGGGKQVDATPDDDNEQYSRQVFTIGARAHGLVRSSTIYVDGPPTSGLVYECVKNLALSGVGNVELWTSNDNIDQHYHDDTLDDLGQSYCRAAAKELNLKDSRDDDPRSLLGNYIRCLNPSVRVSHGQRPKHGNKQNKNAKKFPHGIILCIDRPYETQLRLNEVARQRNLAFVAVETAGVYGRVFCDFGSNFEVHDADGETPVVTPLDHVEVVSGGEESSQNNNEGELLLVRAIETERHDVSKGDTIQFQLSDGSMMPEHFIVVKVLSPQLIHVKLETKAEKSDHFQNVMFKNVINQNAASFCRIKKSSWLSFLPLQQVMEKATTYFGKGGDNSDIFTPCDFDKSFDEKRLKSVLSCFQALSSFVATYKRLPTSKPDLAAFEQLAEMELLGESSSQNEHVRNFVGSCAGKLCPLQALFGALGAQEALKAVTGLYNPVKQILLYDCDELLSSSDDASLPSSTKHASGLSHILGEDMEEKVKAARVFVVGAGAIGCELLKNLAAMGVGTGKDGCISLTDMDTIEKSNLSRQLLFREQNIGDYKSLAARDAILRFNPAIQINTHTSKVGQESDGPFGEEFWSSGTDIVLNALDNMEARLFVDQQCVAFQKALIDAGTLGPKGNVQVVVPHQSESYGSSVDPPESEIPVCTLKNFPYAIAHTIQWGRDLFGGLFNRRPKQANDMAPICLAPNGANELAQTLIRDLGDAAAIEAAREIYEDLSFVSASSDFPRSRANSIQWAAQLATRLFRDAIEDLLREHPVDSVDEDGEPFWTGTRKVPKPIHFVKSLDTDDTSSLAANENLLEFVQSAARLRLETLFGQNYGNRISQDEAREALLATSEGSVSRQDSSEESKSAQEKMIVDILQPVTSSSKSKDLLAIEFEKDDNENGHVQFVNAASNLRALCYGIAPVDAMETRRVAGKIIPAMITTTAVVSALSCVELLKLLQGVALQKHRNAFINLALPFFAFTVPLPAEKVLGPHGTEFTVWDSIVIHEKVVSEHGKGLTLKRFIHQLKNAISDDPDGLEVSSVSAGDNLVYADFLHGDDGTMMHQSIWDLACGAESEEGETSVESNPSSGTQVELRVTVEDRASGEDFELPPVRLHRSESII